MARGKKYTAAVEGLDKTQVHLPKAALKLIRDKAFAKFDESVEIHFSLGIDSRHAEQQLRGVLSLPHGTGKSIRLAVVCKEDRVKEAKDSGADEAGADDLIERIAGGWLEFDLLLATPDMMAKVGRLGKLLGTKGLMPNPKSGTVTNDLSESIKAFKAGRVEYRNDKNNNLHLVIGKLSFSDDQLMENFESVYDVISKAKPQKSKGVYFKNIVLASTMGPGVRVESLKTKWKGN